MSGKKYTLSLRITGAMLNRLDRAVEQMRRDSGLGVNLLGRNEAVLMLIESGLKKLEENIDKG